VDGEVDIGGGCELWN
jgi:hypothetical protein